MTKADLSKEIYKQLGISRKESFRIVEMVIDTLKVTPSEGGTVKIAGFGSFLVRKKGLRKGRILKTGEEIAIEPRRVVTFKPSNQFKAMVEKV